MYVPTGIIDFRLVCAYGKRSTPPSRFTNVEDFEEGERNFMAFRHVYLVPILFGVWLPATCIVTYVVAVIRKDVVAIFPYISDTGNWAPESCIFGIMLTFGAINIILIGYIRYRQVRHICEENDCKPNILKYNKISFYISCISALGMIIVANFQLTNVFIVHMAGAFLCYGSAVVYQTIQVIISYKLYPLIGQISVNILRIFSTVVCCICFCLCGIFGGLSSTKFKGEDITKWTRKDGGFEFHIISTICEWICSAFVVLFLVSYTKEFRLIEFEEPVIKHRK